MKFEGPSRLCEIAGYYKSIAAVVTFPKKHQASPRLGMKLAHKAGGLAASNFHKTLRRGSGGEGCLLRFEHLGGGEDQGIRRNTT